MAKPKRKEAPPAKVAEEEQPAKRGKGRAVKESVDGAAGAKKVEMGEVKKPSAPGGKAPAKVAEKPSTPRGSGEAGKRSSQEAAPATAKVAEEQQPAKRGKGRAVEAAPPPPVAEEQRAKRGMGRAVEAVAPVKLAEEQQPAKRGKRAVAVKAANGSAEGTTEAKKVVVKKPSAGKGKAGKASADGAAEAKTVEKEAGKKPNGGKRAAGEAVKRAVSEWSVEHITAQSEWPITTGGYMQTPTFHPTTEEFADFHAYMNKLDRLVGHMGVCKIVPPPGWQPRKHDFYTLEDSLPALDESVTVCSPSTNLPGLNRVAPHNLISHSVLIKWL